MASESNGHHRWGAHQRKAAWIGVGVVVALSLVPMHLMRHVPAPVMILMPTGFAVVMYSIAQVFLARVDRLRGRLRAGELPCPRCEYPMPSLEGEWRTCPECGYMDTEQNIRLEWKWRTRQS